MAEEKNKTLYFEGIDDLLIVFMTKEDTVLAKPEYDTELYQLPIITKLGVKGNGTTKKKFASSKVFRRVSKETEHEISLDHVGIPIHILDKMKKLVATKGVVFNTATPKEMAYFAFGFIGRIEGGHRMAVWYPKVQLNNATELDYETMEDDDDIKDVKAAFTAGPLLYNDVLNAAYDTTRESSELITLADFVTAPIFEEAQLSEITAPARQANQKGDDN